MLATVGSAIFCVNFYVDYFFSITTDTSIMPQVLYQDTENFKVLVNFTSSAACIFLSLFMLYISV
jgi:hypothetical protein